MHQDVDLFASRLSAGSELTHVLRTDRSAWLQVVDGDISVNGETLNAGDGASVRDTDELSIRAITEAEFLLFDLG